MVCDGVIDVRKDTGDGGGTHHILTFMVLGHSLQIFVLTWRVVRSYALLINLGVCWQTIEKGVELGVQFDDLRRRVNSWLLCYNV
jgi:hypothetical protein